MIQKKRKTRGGSLSKRVLNRFSTDSIKKGVLDNPNGGDPDTASKTSARISSNGGRKGKHLKDQGHKIPPTVFWGVRRGANGGRGGPSKEEERGNCSGKILVKKATSVHGEPRFMEWGVSRD